MQMKKAVSLLLTLVLLLGVFAGITPSASAAAADATLSVDLDPERNTGEIIHGAAGFLYGISSEDVPTTNTIVPLKSKILWHEGRRRYGASVWRRAGRGEDIFGKRRSAGHDVQQQLLRCVRRDRNHRSVLQ